MIGAGLIGSVEQEIKDDEIPEDVGTITEIKSTFSIKKAGSDDRIFTIPVIIEVNAADE